MNRIRLMEESLDKIEGCVVREVVVYDLSRSTSLVQGVAIKTKGNITHRIFNNRTCCEFVKVELPENIPNIHSRQIMFINLDEKDVEEESFEYKTLAKIKITDSLGEEYIIEFTAKSSGCLYTPCIIAEKQWTACVFN